MRFFYSIILLLPFCLLAQVPDKVICHHLNNKNGLMHGSINSMVQDKDGFVWIAGDEGLQRYDGYEFVNYYHNPNKPNKTLPNGRLNNIAIDTKNRLWVGSFADGFGWHNIFNNTYKNYNFHNQRMLNPASIGFRGFLFINDSVTYACSTDGVVKLVHDSITKTFSPTNSALQGGLVGKIAKDKNGNIWIGTIGGLNFLSADEKHLYNHTNDKNIAAFTNNVLKDNVGNKAAIAELFLDSRNNLWISTWKPEIYRYDINKNILETIQLPNKKPFEYDNMGLSYVQDNDGNVWIGTSNNGLYKYSYTSNSYQHFLHNNDDVQSIGSNSISQLMKDRQGNIWLASENNISIFNPSNKLLQYLLPNNHGAVTATLVSKDKTLWAADMEWLYHFDKQFNLIVKYRHQSNINPKLLDNSVWKLKESINGNEIFLAKEKGLAIFNKQFVTVDLFNDIGVLKNNPITDIIELHNGNMYLCRWWWDKNLLFLNRQKRIAEAVAIPIDDRNNFEISGAIQKDANQYYLFSKRGLMMLDASINKASLLDSNYVVGSTVLLNNQFYSATATEGIRHYDLTTKKTTTISKYDGFPVYNTKNIAYAGSNNFWVASHSGLVKWNSLKKTTTVFGTDEGIANTALYGNALALMEDGKVVFSNGQLMVLDTALIKKQLPPKVAIISCIAGDSLLTPEQVSSSFNISYTNNVLQVRFAAINYPSTNMKYEYMLEGYDDVWKDGSLRFVNYTNLPHGNYVFKVRAAGDDGTWGNDVTMLKFHVSQAFYKAWWFYALPTAIILGGIFFYYRIRIKRILELQKLRNNISRDLHDEVGSTLSSISILSTSVVNNMEHEPMKSKEWVNQIGKYAQHMLNVMDDIVWAINPKVDSFESMVSRMKESAYSTTEAADIKVSFSYDEQLSNLSLPMLTKRDLYLIFKETINNAVKHSHCQHIAIELKKQHGKLLLIIKDNGTGFDMDKPTNRNGLKNMKQRAAEMNGTISFESNEQGTKMELTIVL